MSEEKEKVLTKEEKAARDAEDERKGQTLPAFMPEGLSQSGIYRPPAGEGRLGEGASKDAPSPSPNTPPGSSAGTLPGVVRGSTRMPGVAPSPSENSAPLETGSTTGTTGGGAGPTGQGSDS